MSWQDNYGIIHNSFYETQEELGIQSMSDEQEIEYKRLIGMPLSDDYDELIENLIVHNAHIHQEESEDLTYDFFTEVKGRAYTLKRETNKNNK